MMRYLKQDEKIESKALWAKVFDEDSQSFMDYYYSDRVKRNKILAAWDGERVVAMLHRNPYEVVIRDRLWKTDYIAGVATDPEYRHQGYMKRLLLRCFSDMYVERMGFSFLVPADPAIYRPFDYTYICDLPSQELNEKGLSQLSRRALVEQSGQCREAARFAGRQLEQSYEVYALRDEGYYRDLCREVRSDKGDLILLYTRDEEEQLAGIWAYYGETAENKRELICLPDYIKETGPKKPAVMGRIIHLEQFVSVICLKEDCPASEMELLLEVKDNFIQQNAGIYRWKLDHNGSSLVRVEGDAGIKPHLSMGIGELTSWLFGYSEPSVPEESMVLAERIRLLNGVFFDEIT